MRSVPLRGLLFACAVAFPLLGLWLSAQTLRTTPVTIGHISAKCDALEELRAMRTGNASTQSAQQALDDLSVFQHQDLVGAGDGRQPVGDHKSGSPGA